MLMNGTQASNHGKKKHIRKQWVVRIQADSLQLPSFQTIFEVRTSKILQVEELSSMTNLLLLSVLSIFSLKIIKYEHISIKFIFLKKIQPFHYLFHKISLINKIINSIQNLTLLKTSYI